MNVYARFDEAGDLWLPVGTSLQGAPMEVMHLSMINLDTGAVSLNLTAYIKSLQGRDVRLLDGHAVTMPAPQDQRD